MFMFFISLVLVICYIIPIGPQNISDTIMGRRVWQLSIQVGEGGAKEKVNPTARLTFNKLAANCLAHENHIKL